jgi:hypothetical protein
MHRLKATFPANSWADLNAEFAGDMAKAGMPPIMGCSNRKGCSGRVPCVMANAHACGARVGREDVSSVVHLTPASMAAGNAAAPPVRIDSGRYDIALVHNGATTIVRWTARGWES